MTAVTAAMYKLALAVLCLAASARAAPEQPRDLVCDICVDIIQDIDDFLTSDTTEQEIIDFVEGVSRVIEIATKVRGDSQCLVISSRRFV